jgi:hypothetical protein
MLAASPSIMESIFSLVERIEKVLETGNPGSIEVGPLASNSETTVRPQLIVQQSLYGVLQAEHITRRELSIWAIAKPCQVEAMAWIVGQTHWSMSLFKWFAQIPEFVEAFLQTNDVGVAFNKVEYVVMCTPLTESWSDCQPVLAPLMLKDDSFRELTVRFLRKVAAATIEGPDEESLRHLSKLCEAIPSNLLEVFSEEVLIELSSRCRDVFSDKTASRTDIERMLAHGLLAQFAMAFQTPQTTSKSSLETPPGAKYSDACRKRIAKLFVENNGASSIKLTVLRLAMFCSEERGSSPATALEATKLAQHIVAPIPLHVRKQFVEENLRLVQKYVSRLNRQALDVQIRLEVGYKTALQDSAYHS